MIIAASIFASGLVLAWTLSVIALIIEDNLAAQPRERAVWRHAHRQALFWLFVVLSITIAIRSLEVSDDFAVVIRRVASAIGALLGALAAAHASNEFLSWYVRGRLRVRPFLSNTALPIAQRFANIAIVITAVVFVLDAFDQPVTPLLAILSVFGFGIALALRDPLANFFAGTMLATDGGLRVGDSIELDSEHGSGRPIMGTVVSIGWRSTRVITRNANVVTLPNNKLSESFLTNYSIPTRDMGITINAGVVLGSDLTRVEEVVSEVAEQIQADHAITGQGFAPSFFFGGLTNNTVEFSVGLRARSYDLSFELRNAFIKALDARFREENIELAIPASRVDLHHLNAADS